MLTINDKQKIAEFVLANPTMFVVADITRKIKGYTVFGIRSIPCSSSYNNIPSELILQAFSTEPTL